MRRHFVAVDIGGSKIALLARAGLDGADVLADKLPTPKRSRVVDILGILDAFIDALPGGRKSVRGVGVAVPGHVDAEGNVLRAGNLTGWDDVPFRARLRSRYGVPAFVEGDANCGALGEKWKGAARDLNDFVFLAAGTGIGAGIVLNGSIHRGAHSAAGEPGSVVLPMREGKEVAELAGKRAIQKQARRATKKKLRSGDALGRAEHDAKLASATRDAIDSLAVTVAAIWTLIDPEAIILGGGTAQSGPKLLRQLRQRVRPLRPNLLGAALGSEAQLYGALWGAGQT